MRRWTPSLVPYALWLGVGCCNVAQAQCPPPTRDFAQLQHMKAEQWMLSDGERRQTLALALLPCLSHPDPAIRDGLAFEGLSALLRAKQLTVASQRTIFLSQLAQLTTGIADTNGFAKPFAALVLSEIARADRLVPFLNTAERAALLGAGAQYLTNLRDYRGFATGEGWRHAVAHAADLMLQLALNPAINAAQLEHILKAVQSQVVPVGDHFYIYGESDRLARPVIFAARRGLLDAGFWHTYIAQLASPGPLVSWGDASGTQAGLARLHNTKSFLRALDAGARGSDNAAVQAAFEAALPLALKGLP